MYARVIKKISHHFLVRTETEEFECFASKKLIDNGEKIVVGDIVRVEYEKKYILEIKTRKNEIKRPSIANIDISFLVFSIVEPNLNFYLLDKFICIAESQKLEIAIIITKMDKKISDEYLISVLEKLNYYRNLGYKVILKEDDWINKIEKIVSGKIAVFSGQTGVGKSTLINTLNGNSKIKTQEISFRLSRGKHTTTHSELYNLFNGYIADTPGFSSFDLSDIDEKTIRQLYIEFYEESFKCKFRDCSHGYEIKCEIKKMVKDGKIPEWRYNNYVQIRKEIKEGNQWKKW